MSRTRLPPKTPPHSSMVAFIDEEPETPAPARAQITNLKKQVQALVRNEHNTSRKHTAEVAELQRKLASLQTESKDAAQLKKTAEVREAEFKRLREEGEKMREELNLHSVIAQQKALLAVATEQLQIIELEQRLVQADAARLMRDHKITLFKAKEADMIADMAEKDARIDELEAELDGANTSIAHQRAAQAKASKLQSTTSQKELEEQQGQIQSLQSKVESLESRLRGSKAREADLKEELEAALSDTRKDGTDKEKRELQRSLRETKASLEKKAEEVVDLQEELANLKEASKQREQALKAKVKEAATERDRLLGVEEELEGLKAGKGKLANAVPTDKQKPKSHKVALKDDSDVDEVTTIAPKASPKKRAKPVDSDDEMPYKPPTGKPPKAKTTTAMQESASNDGLELALSKTKSKLALAGEKAKAEPEKKKKRKLIGGGKPVFEWDPVMQSGDGVIPAYLSPAKPAGKGSTGIIPRAGFKSIPSSRGLGKLL